jgi:hypothetical protein
MGKMIQRFFDDLLRMDILSTSHIFGVSFCVFFSLLAFWFLCCLVFCLVGHLLHAPTDNWDEWTTKTIAHQRQVSGVFFAFFFFFFFLLSFVSGGYRSSVQC